LKLNRITKFNYLYKVYNPNKGGGPVVPNTGTPINPGGRGYVPPESQSGSYYGGGSPSSPSTVYIYKGKEYYSEADVKNAIASNILESPKVQEIIKKQGGSSSTVYVYQGSTYANESEVKAQIEKNTVQTTGYAPQSASQTGFSKSLSSNVPGILPFTAQPFSMSSRWLESDVIEQKPTLLGTAKSYVLGAGEQSKFMLGTVGGLVKRYNAPTLIYGAIYGKKPSFKEYKEFTEERAKSLKESKNIPTFYKGTGYVVGLVNPYAGGTLITAGSSMKGFKETDTTKLTTKEAVKIAGTSAAEGALFAVGGKVLSGSGSLLGKKIGGYAAKEGGSRIIKSGAGTVSKYSPNIGEYAKNLIDTYFLGQVGTETVRLGSETYQGYKVGEWNPAARTGIGLGSSLAGFAIGSASLTVGSTLRKRFYPTKEETLSQPSRGVKQFKAIEQTSINLAQQIQPTKTTFEGNIREPKITKTKVKQPEVTLTRNVIEKPLFQTAGKVIYPMVSEVRAKSAKGEVTDVYVKSLVAVRPIKDVTLSYSKNKALESSEFIPKSSTYELIGYNKGTPQYMFRMPKQETTVYGWKRLKPVSYARQSKEFVFRVEPFEKYNKLYGSGWEHSAGFYQSPPSHIGGKPGIMVRQEVKPRMREEVVAHEIIHSKTPKSILEFGAFNKLPYRFQPAEILSFGLQKYYAKKGFKVPITERPRVMTVEEASGMGEIVNLGFPEVKGGKGKTIKTKPDIMITTSEFAKPIISKATPDYLKVLTETKPRYYTETFFEATRKGDKTTKVKGRITGVSGFTKEPLITEMTMPELKDIEKIGMGYFPSKIDRGIIVSESGRKKVLSVGEGELSIIRKGRVQKKEVIKPYRGISSLAATWKGGGETFQIWSGFGSDLPGKKQRFGGEVTLMRLGKPKTVRTDEGSSIIKSVKGRPVVSTMNRNVAEQIAKSVVGEEFLKPRKVTIVRKEKPFNSGRRITSQELEGLSTQPTFTSYYEDYAFPRSRKSFESSPERGLSPKFQELAFPRSFMSNPFSEGMIGKSRERTFPRFKTSPFERQSIFNPLDQTRIGPKTRQDQPIKQPTLPREDIIPKIDEGYRYREDTLTRQDLLREFRFDIPATPLTSTKGPFPVPFPMFPSGGGGLGGGRGGFTVSRAYRYTPNLVGIEFGRALKKTPKGNRIWSGFELRPLVKGGL
jgi:hypothetical protein